MSLAKTAKERYWKSFDFKRTNFEPIAYKLILAVFESQLKDILKAVNDSVTPQEASRGVNEAIDSDKMKKAIIEIYKRVGLSFAIQSYISMQDTKADRSVLQYDTWSENVARYIETHGIDRVITINETTKEFVAGILEQAAKDGLSILNTAKLITEKFEEMERWRAVRIARTEIVSASNRGAIIGAESTGLDYDKVWITQIDGRERDAHAEADDKRVGKNEDFYVGGEFLEMPGDPTGEPENIINCRCAIGFKPKRNYLFD